MDQQVWVAADRAGEVGVGLKRQTEMAFVVWRVNRLRHRAQQHGVNLLRLRAVFGGRCDALVFRRLRVIAEGLLNPHRLQIIAQDVLLLGRGAFVYPKQARVLALADEVC